MALWASLSGESLMPSFSDMNIAVIGTNFISDDFCDAALAVDGVKVNAVYSRTPERGFDFSRKHGIERVYTDYSEMLSDKDIDAVYIASPIFAHAQQSVRAIRAGKHVLCEKMMAATLDEFYEMKSASEKYGRVLLEAMRPAHDPLWRAVKENLPRIGKIRRASLEFCQYSSRYDKFKSGEVLNAFDPKIKNSALSDIGIYPLFAVLHLFGEPKSLDSRSVFLENGFEGAGVLTLGYPETLVTVTYSKIFGGSLPSVIEGEDGSIIINKISAPTEITLKLRGKAPELIARAESEKNMRYEIEAFRDMCEGRCDHKPYLEVTELQQKIVDKSYRLTGADKFF